VAVGHADRVAGGLMKKSKADDANSFDPALTHQNAATLWQDFLRLTKENAELKRLNLELADRCEKQSQLLSRKAEK